MPAWKAALLKCGFSSGGRVMFEKVTIKRESVGAASLDAAPERAWINCSSGNSP
jgi:hypothetical protein